MPTIIEMPKLSDTMTSGTLVNWLKKEGDRVAAGDMLAEVETDKATMELENFEDGVLLKVFVQIGAQVPVGTPICAIGAAGESVEVPPARPAAATAPKPAAPAAVAAAPTPAAPPPPAARAPAPVPPAPAVAAEGERLKASPLARRLAEQLGLALAGVTGSGPGGRIVREDVLAAAQSLKAPAPVAAAAQAAVPAPVFSPAASVGPIQAARRLPLSNMRAVIARRLLESKTQIPHFYLETEVDAAPLLALRAQLNATFGEGSKVSVNDLVLKASAVALRRVPAVNASFDGDAIQYHEAAHVSFAVAVEEGLLTPVVRDCHAKSLFQIGAEARQLAQLAKEKKLKPEQFTGGTFCVSNLGMLGVDRFFAIINPPNAAILAVGAVVKKPVVDASGALGIGQRMQLGLSCDHRVVDGAVGAQFLAALREALEKPLLLLA